MKHRFLPLIRRHSAIVIALALLVLLTAATAYRFAEAAQKSKNDPDRKDWVQLFNGIDLKNWAVKIKGYDLNDNFGNTFRVENGVMKVGYEKYDKFNDRFGHIFYRQKFSHSIIAAEYRFTGEQYAGGAGWATRNSGIMVHCQSPESWARIRTFRFRLKYNCWAAWAMGRAQPQTRAHRARTSR